MDRREALRKLVAGGAVVAGSSFIASAPAFADGGSFPHRPVPGPGFHPQIDFGDYWSPPNIVGQNVYMVGGSEGTFSCPLPSPASQWYAVQSQQTRWSISGGDVGYPASVTGSTWQTNANYAQISGANGLRGTYVLTLEHRSICRMTRNVAPGETIVTWICRRVDQSITYTTDLATPGAPVNSNGSPQCDSPPP